jgi:microcin C transport system substrate-binding protein
MIGSTSAGLLAFLLNDLEGDLSYSNRIIPVLFAVGWMLAGPALANESEELAAGEVVPRAHGLAMHGDLKYPADFSHFEYVNPDAPKGGEFRQAAIGTFDSFHPFIVKGVSAAGIGLLYESLTEQSQDEPFSQYGVLAETIQTPVDRSWVTFTLREQARWHDGRPVTADDVIWTFNTLIAKGAPLYRFYYESVERVEKTGERSITFHFKPGDNRELPLILGQLAVLPKHYWENREFDATTLDPPLGSGPYEIESFEAGRFIRYKRRNDYWGAELPVNRGQNNFDFFRYDYYRDTDVAIEALKGGAFDFRLENNSKKWATAYEIPEVREGRLRKELVAHKRPQGMQGFAFNLRRSLFQDRRVREAITYVFDFEWSNKTLFYGQYARSRSYFENSELAATGLPSPAELEILEPLRGRIPEEVFTTEYQPPKTDGSGRNRSNLRKAAELLAEAGWTIVDGKLAHTESGVPMVFEFLLVQPGAERYVLPFKKNLERVGIEAKVRTVDVAQYVRRMDSYDFDITVDWIRETDSPGNEQREFWGSESAKREGGRNLIGIQDPAVDELVELLIAAPDREALVTRVRALDRVLQWGHYMIPQMYTSSDRLLYWDRFGKPEIAPSQGILLNAWWFDADKAAQLAPAKRDTAP